MDRDKITRISKGYKNIEKKDVTFKVVDILLPNYENYYKKYCINY